MGQRLHPRCHEDCGCVSTPFQNHSRAERQILLHRSHRLKKNQLVSAGMIVQLLQLSAERNAEIDFTIEVVEWNFIDDVFWREPLSALT